MSRRDRPRGRRPRGARRGPDICADHVIPDWVEVCDRRMFVVDYTPAGFPIGVFEDDMDRDGNDDPGTWPGDEFF